MKNIVTLAVSTILMAGAWGATGASIKSEEITYQAGGTTLKGYIAYDSSIRGKRPGIIVVHEWWGLNEYVKYRARMLAELGYTALAVDMYGEGKTAANPEEASKLSSAVMSNLDQAEARFNAAVEVLKKHKTVDKRRLGAIGYCFGGGIVLNMAARGADLAGVASFHGSLGAVQPAKPGQIKARLFVAHGAADVFVTEEQVEAFKKNMRGAGADLTFISYPNATHAFTNPDSDRTAKEFKMPIAYNPEADRKSWEDLQSFLNGIFAKR
jgi:dienelactone hydrolase